MDTKPGLSPEMLRFARTSLSLLGIICWVLAHTGVIQIAPDMKQLFGELGALLAGKEAFKRLGDVPLSEHLLEVFRATTRPPSMPPPAAEQ